MSPKEFDELKRLVHSDKVQRERLAAHCWGKHPFDSFATAEKTISARLRGLVLPYHCVGCGAWHIGGISRPRRLAIEKRRHV